VRKIIDLQFLTVKITTALEPLLPRSLTAFKSIQAKQVGDNVRYQQEN